MGFCPQIIFRGRDQEFSNKERSFSLIGSGTNSSCEDVSRVASLVQQAKDAGLSLKCTFMVSPGSQQVTAAIVRDGVQNILIAVKIIILSGSCEQSTVA